MIYKSCLVKIAALFVQQTFSLSERLQNTLEKYRIMTRHLFVRPRQFACLSIVSARF